MLQSMMTTVMYMLGNALVYQGKCCMPHCTLGEACNHIAALLFFIENHVNDEELPLELSKTSKSMAWHQPPKKEVTAECARNMKFVKPSHGDNPDLQKVREVHLIHIDQSIVLKLTLIICMHY